MTAVLLIVIGLLVAVAAYLTMALRRQVSAREKELSRVLAEEEDIVAGERRMFCFLHDLGEAISREEDYTLVHRLIVEGAMRVTESRGGALYLWDEATQSLVPKHCSDLSAPLVNLAERIVQLAKENPSSLLSYQRLHSIPDDEGLLGGIFQTQKAELLVDVRKDTRLKSVPNGHQQHITAMIGPLSCGNRRLGVLAVTLDRREQTFSSNDFEVFNSLVEQSAFALANALAHQEAQAKRQIEAELRSAGEIQRILLPEHDPNVPGFVITGRNLPAKVLSGDYYDYVQVDESHLGIAIADVSGKGTAAAIISAMCRSVLRSHAPGNLSPASALAAVNRLLFPDIREDMFISMVYGILDTTTGQLTLTRAGHTYPLLWHAASGEVEELKSGGLAVGIDKGNVFERVTKEITVQMEPGDCLLLYTDGVNEAVDSKGLEFGEDRIRQSLIAHSPNGARAVVDGLITELEKFLGGRRSLDDITLIALQKTA